MTDDHGGAGPGRGEGARRTLALLAVLWPLLAPGCAPEPRPAAEAPGSRALAVQVYADTGRGGRLSVRPPAARVWLARVTPAPARPGQVPAPPPEPSPLAPESLIAHGDAWPAPEAESGLRPPVLRAPARLVLPAGRRAAGWVDLDVFVDEAGAVREAVRVGGSEDTALVAAALGCALSMRFYPALRAGREVPVWCRQRFDFPAARSVPRTSSGR